MENDLGEVLSLKQEGTIHDYCDAFETCFNTVNICEVYAVYLFISGLKPETAEVLKGYHNIGSSLTLKEAFSLARIQETTLKLDSTKLKESQFTNRATIQQVSSYYEVSTIVLRQEDIYGVPIANGRAFESEYSSQFTKVESAPKVFDEMPKRFRNEILTSFDGDDSKFAYERVPLSLRLSNLGKFSEYVRVLGSRKEFCLLKKKHLYWIDTGWRWMRNLVPNCSINDVEGANDVFNKVSRYEGVVSFIQLLPKQIVPNQSQIEYSNHHPLLLLCAYGSFRAGGNAWGAPSYSVRCSSYTITILQAAQLHFFDVVTLEKEYTFLTNPIVTSFSQFENIGSWPLAMSPRWNSGSVVALPNTHAITQHLTHSTILTVSGLNESIISHYATESSKQLVARMVTLGDIDYTKLLGCYTKFPHDGNISQHLSGPGRKVNGNSNGHFADTENVGRVIVRYIMSKSAIKQFTTHDNTIASLWFTLSGSLLMADSFHSHSFNDFRIISDPINCASYLHLYMLQCGLSNTVIQDISFSVYSRWVTLSSSRGTTHLFSIFASCSQGIGVIYNLDYTISNDEFYHVFMCMVRLR